MIYTNFREIDKAGRLVISKDIRTNAYFAIQLKILFRLRESTFAKSVLTL